MRFPLLLDPLKRSFKVSGSGTEEWTALRMLSCRTSCLVPTPQSSYKIFGYRYFESVTYLQNALGRPTSDHTWEALFEKRKSGFDMRALTSPCVDSSLVRALSN